MASTKIYSNEIDISKHWHRLDTTELGKDPSIASLFDEEIFNYSLEDHIGANDIKLEISYKDFANFESLLGYEDPFFQTSPAIYNGKAGTYEGLRNELILAKLNCASSGIYGQMIV